MKLTLISHALCPYVQRAAIVLAEKDATFERFDIDLANKPDWFKAVSPLGKTPVLLVDDDALFEFAVICEYLDDTILPRLHPADALKRAKDRAWVEFGSALLGTVGALYNAADPPALARIQKDIQARFTRLESVLPDQAPYFSGSDFSMVDAAFGPLFRYFDVLEAAGEQSLFEALPKVQTWRAALARRPSVRQAVGPNYPQDLHRFLLSRGSELSRRLAASASKALPAC